jgi:hypothetical protein
MPGNHSWQARGRGHDPSAGAPAQEPFEEDGGAGVDAQGAVLAEADPLNPMGDGGWCGGRAAGRVRRGCCDDGGSVLITLLGADGC